MPAKKPSAKPTRGTKTVSAKPAARVAAKAAARPVPKVKAAPVKAALAKAALAKAAAAKAAAAKAAPSKAAQPRAAVAKAPARTPLPKAVVKPASRPKAATPAPAPVVKPRQSFKPAPGVATTVAGMSLLSGPRNVEPYVPRKGEEYMSKTQLEHFHAILSNWKQDLMQEVDRTMLHMKDEAANFPDPNDRATQESEFSLELRTRDRERKLIRKIDEALKRIEDGTYGYCLETGEPIGVKRLEARPVATLSVEAQERRERREKQFGDRDDWYR